MSAAESARLRDSGIVTPAWLYRPQLDPITDAVVWRVSAAAATPHPGEARDWRPAQVPASAITSMAQVATPPARAGRPDDVTLARLAQAVYSDGASLPSGWGEATSLDMRAIGVRSADLVAADSGFRARVYAEGTGADRRFVIAFRGSTSGRGDWISNGRQSAGLPSDHYRAALLVGQGLAQRRSAARVTLTGHSLAAGSRPRRRWRRGATP